MSGLTVSLSQEISFPWESEFRRSREKYKFYSAKSEYQETMERVKFQIYSLYSDLLYWEKYISIYKENKKTLNEIIRVARARVSVNKMNSSQLLKLEADLAMLDNKIWQGEANLEKVRSKIEALSGQTFPWDSLRIAQAEFDFKLPKQTAFVPQRHPLYLQARQIYLAEKANAAWKKGKLFPSVTISGAYTFRNEIPGRDQGEDFLSLKASVPLPLFYPIKDRFEIKEAEKKAQQSKSVLEEIKLKLLSAWKEEYAKAKRNFMQYENYKKTVIPRQLATYKAQLGALSSGTVTLLDVLDAYRRYLDLSLAQAQNKRDLDISLFKLNYLLSKSKGENHE
ncbi:MAG: TolC family protein [Candidatus Hydrogenedentota bacterium]|nr:MAG: TolC family protein [Candidatus Hydrogenedentota bacterium]